MEPSKTTENGEETHSPELDKKKSNNHKKAANNNNNNSRDAAGEDNSIVGPDIRKLKKQEYHELILDNMPSADRYELSYMHREFINNVIVTSKNDYIITFSVDGHIKFWRKVFHLIEFAKHFKAHNGLITGVSLSKDHQLMATVSIDRTLKIFDIRNCDLMTVVKLNFSPCACEFIPQENIDKYLVAISEDRSGRIIIVKIDEEQVDKQDNDTFTYSDLTERENKAKEQQAHNINSTMKFAVNPNYPFHNPETNKQDPEAKYIVHTLSIHSHPVKYLKMNWQFGVCVSVDERAIIELWDPLTFDFPQNKGLGFQFKLDTDYNSIATLSSIPLAFSMSPKGKYIAIMLKDRMVHIFHFKSGRLLSSINESIKQAIQIQENPASQYHEMFSIDRNELDRRVSVQKELETSKQYLAMPSMDFDECEEFLIYSSIVGIKFYNIKKKQIMRILGKNESERFLKLALYQGKSMRNPTGSSTIKGEKRGTDPTIYATAFRKNRFYIFSKKMPDEGVDKTISRDILNERPNKEELQMFNQVKSQDQTSEVILQTTLGDIHLKLYPEDTPKTCENFIKLARKGYYDGMIFHRVIKGFMVQSGCPRGDGTGGESIWGHPFEDQIVLPKLRHQRAFILSMANAGPNTNGSQFFITVIPCPWLDGKHTVFGRVSKGMEVVMEISKVKTDKIDKPLINIKIIKARVV